MNAWETLLGAVPTAPAWEIDWELLDQTPLAPYIRQMAETPQETAWHGEGNVWTHTKMVCEVLTANPDFRALPGRKRELAFLGALFHDIAKPSCTRWEDGAWRSPNHTVEGERLARRILWQDFGLCGQSGKTELRECICALVRYHSIPGHLVDMKNPERRLLDIASLGQRIPDFSLNLLRLVAEADNLGRVSAEQGQTSEKLRQCFAMAEHLGVLHDLQKASEDAEDIKEEVILVCGAADEVRLRRIEQRYPNLPVVSERRDAKRLLRENRAFVWNEMENASTERSKVLSFLAQRNVRTRIVYLESDYMPENTELPKPTDAYAVEWICTKKKRN